MKEKRLSVRANQELLDKLKELSTNSKRLESDYIRLLIEYAFDNKIKL
ncbi:MAG: hypothetical protein Q7W45_02950 [Bacteroidota bacterium]|nr:hypothetical protein [Bacteroidota bacterium]MDP3145787.1 hypothetical protein [Bacteroidota bacterium]